MPRRLVAVAPLRADSRPELSREDIVAVTVRLCADVGMRHVSMRRLAAELGVTATALYYHVPDKATLLGWAAEIMIDEFARPKIAGSWSDRLRDLLIEENRLLRRYPGLARYLLEHRDSIAALRWSEAFVALLLEAGFSEESAAREFGRISMLINPLFLLDDFSEGTTGGTLMTPWIQALGDESEQFPSLARVREHMGAASFDEMFEMNAHVLVDTLEAELRSERRAHKTRLTST